MAVIGWNGGHGGAGAPPEPAAARQRCRAGLVRSAGSVLCISRHRVALCVGSSAACSCTGSVLMAWLLVVLRKLPKEQERAMSGPGTAAPRLPPAAGPFYLHGSTVGLSLALGQAFRHGFTYRGRASRSAYWWFVLFQAICLAALVTFIAVASAVTGGPARVHGTIAGDTIGVTLIIAYLFLLYLALVSLALLVRRLHDTGRTGWWACIAIVPFAGPLILLIVTTLAGEPVPNRYDQF